MPLAVEGLPVGLVVDVGVLGCCQTGVFAGDQAELDELALEREAVGVLPPLEQRSA